MVQLLLLKLAGPKRGKYEHAHGKKGGVDHGPHGANNFKHKKGKRGGKKAKAKGACFNCGKKGHFACNCTELKKVLPNSSTP